MSDGRADASARITEVAAQLLREQGPGAVTTHSAANPMPCRRSAAIPAMIRRYACSPARLTRWAVRSGGPSMDTPTRTACSVRKPHQASSRSVALVWMWCSTPTNGDINAARWSRPPAGRLRRATRRLPVRWAGTRGRSACRSSSRTGHPRRSAVRIANSRRWASLRRASPPAACLPALLPKVPGSGPAGPCATQTTGEYRHLGRPVRDVSATPPLHLRVPRVPRALPRVPPMRVIVSKLCEARITRVVNPGYP